jgi:hypothetical protein
VRHFGGRAALQTHSDDVQQRSLAEGDAKKAAKHDDSEDGEESEDDVPLTNMDGMEITLMRGDKIDGRALCQTYSKSWSQFLNTAAATAAISLQFDDQEDFRQFRILRPRWVSQFLGVVAATYCGPKALLDTWTALDKHRSRQYVVERNATAGESDVRTIELAAALQSAEDKIAELSAALQLAEERSVHVTITVCST